MNRATGRGLLETIDWKLVICYIILILIGWVNIYASIHSSEPSSIFDPAFRSGKQFIWIVTSLGLASLILFVLNPRIYESLSVPIYAFTIILLVAVIFLGVEVKGSRSWFSFGPISFQPAELSKIATSLMLATFMSQSGYKMSNMKDFLATAAIILVPMAIIVAQSETGSALVYVGFVFMLYREGLSGWLLFMIGMAILLFILTLTSSAYISILVLAIVTTLCSAMYYDRIKSWLKIYLPSFIVLGLLPFLHDKLSGLTDNPEAFILKVKPMYIFAAAAAVSIPIMAFKAFRSGGAFRWLAIASFIVGVLFVFSVDFLFHDVLQDHQRKRIEVLLGLKDDPSGVGYNVNQSMIAIGSGGILGKGFLKGTQTTYGFVPEQSTDFIFCTIGEEWGFVGAAAVICLFIFLIWRIISDAEQCREAFTRIYGYCVASCLFMHLFINIGMTIGIMPVIGIPLPFISYGGSSLWAFTVLLFIFIALVRNERKYF
ncbi:MAG: rod shape-determining protein RodA [Bacteroidetes bacterium]|uniref:Cell wall polymerase n=1 Tax=Candidatus Cryptobacteroides intestinigallinarum TaxID=2840767 RepID=A0A9D9N003_9BACT|nr:rod shape-determining protein RodA [Candidatus Cryptobacteroides intestinigallinarum]